MKLSGRIGDFVEAHCVLAVNDGKGVVGRIVSEHIYDGHGIAHGQADAALF